MAGQDTEARKAFFLDLVYPGRLRILIGILATAFYTGSVAIVWWLSYALNHVKYDGQDQPIIMWPHWPIETAKTIVDCLIGIWVLGPPIWFFCEYFFGCLFATDDMESYPAL